MKFCLILPLFALSEIQCADDITPATQTSNPLCGVQGSLHVFAGHSLAFLGFFLSDKISYWPVMCRTIHLHIQICWSHLHVNRVVGIILNVIGWTVPAILLGLVFVVANIAYTISDHCSIRVDWVARLLIIPLIVEISLALFVQILTFGYCVNVYLKSLSEPPPPTGDIFEGAPVSINSFHSTRYPYRKAFARVRKVSPLFGLSDPLGADVTMASLGAMPLADFHRNAVFNCLLFPFGKIYGASKRVGPRKYTRPEGNQLGRMPGKSSI